MRLRLSTVIIAMAAAMLATSVTPTVAHPGTASSAMCCGSTHLEASLHGSATYPNARGHADYGTGMMGGRHFDMDIWNLGSLAGKTLAVYAGSNHLGNMRVGRAGRCHYGHSGRGMPRLAPGAVVRVRTGGGTLVASGTLHRHA
jgi:hypothetical protein